MFPSIDPPLDYFGREIKVGDTVVYGVYTRNGSLNSGVVTKLSVKGDRRRHTILPNGKDGWITVPDWKIQIKVSGSEWDHKAQRRVSTEKLQTLSNPERFAVMEAPNVDS